jgi:hypothetical protein
MYQVKALTVYDISHHCTPTCWSKVMTVISCTLSAIRWNIKWKYWFKVHGVNNFKILLTTKLLWLCMLSFYVKHTNISFQLLMKNL